MRRLLKTFAAVTGGYFFLVAIGIGYMFWSGPRDFAEGKFLKTHSQIVDLRITADTSERRSSFFNFQTTRQAWNSFCCSGDFAEGLAYSGPLIFAVGPLVLLGYGVIGAVTIPYDLFASPFRERQMGKVTSWTTTGRLLNRAGEPLPGVRLTVVYGFDIRGGGELIGSKKTKTRSNGSFSASIIGTPRTDRALSVRIDPGSQIEVLCEDPAHPEKGCDSVRDYWTKHR